MTCREVRSKIGRYIDGELPPEKNQALEGHIAECPRCASEVAALHRVDDLLAEDAAPPSPDLCDAIMRRLPGEQGAKRPWVWLQAKGASQWPMKLAATGVAALAVYTGLLIDTIGQARAPAGDASWLVSASRSPILSAYQGGQR